MLKKTLSYFTLPLLLLSLFLLGKSAGNSAPLTEFDPNVPAVVPGPDVIMGDLPSLIQAGSDGTQVGLAMATDICNNGNVQVNWFRLPETDHPVIPQNLYRMSGGGNNDERFEQIGQSWVKHQFFPLQQNACGFGCTSSPDAAHLGVGCSTPDSASLNGSQPGLGSRAWVNPFTGIFPSTANSHTGHTHSGTAHRLLVDGSDLDTTLNPGATYYAEAQLVTPHEYAWCQANPGQCNMYNNVSYRQFNVVGTTSFSFAAVGDTVTMTPAINAWPGAIIQTIEPEPGTDGRASIAYKVTGPVAGVWHYEYAIYNENLDRGIQSFSVPLGCGIAVSDLGFHAPLNHPGFANDGTLGDGGYSNAVWTSNQTANTLSWSSETFAQNPNGNAIRWGTLYNFRFDSNRPPQAANATIGFFKTGIPVTVGVQGPSPDTCTGATPTPPTTPTPIPCIYTSLREDFDAVTAPDLPAGWVSSFAEGPAGCTPQGVCTQGTNWATTTTAPFSSPNCAFHDAPGCVTDSTLDTPSFVLVTDSFLFFQHSYDLASGFDGAVLEISINGGPFTDFLAAGGTFQSGFYDGTISTGFQSPIAGRAAWTGNSGGYILTTARMPAAASQQNVALRFRLATDCGGVSTGWRVDSIRVEEPIPCPSPTPSPSATPTPTPTATPSATVPPSTPTPSPTPPAQTVNLSTRMFVQTGDDIGIGGFIITGTGPKNVLLRAIGPSLSGSIFDVLDDPMLELHGAGGSVTINDNWRDDQEQEIIATGIPPTDNLEAAILASLSPGGYTAIVRGNGNSVGFALIELYDLDQGAASKLANISTRAFVQVGNDSVIAGFILGNRAGADSLIVRGLGPSLSAIGVPTVLENPTLELRDSNGALLIANNDWQDDPAQAAIITAAGLAPSNDLESAIAAILPPGAYTVLLEGDIDSMGFGNGLVEVYDLGLP